MRIMGSHIRHMLALAAAFALAAPSVQAGESRAYVVSDFFTATYSQDGDCPDGLNPTVEQNFRRVLANQGHPPAEIDKIVATPGSFLKVMPLRGRIGGAPVNVYLNPTSVPD